MTQPCFALVGSSRQEGNTTQAVHTLFPHVSEINHLCTMNISHYDYAYRNANDDFLPLIQKMAQYPTWILATPVYWYTMSSYMKVFLDRMTDLIYHHKKLLDNIRGTRIVLVASTSHPKPDEFAMPIQASCDYLKLSYQGCWDQMYPEDPNQAYNKKQQDSAHAFFEKILKP